MDQGSSNQFYSNQASTSNSTFNSSSFNPASTSNTQIQGDIPDSEIRPVKKKRKQLVSCDSCRIRRVKCDRFDKGGASCTECVKKSINCTDTYIKSKPKVVRQGKLITKARQLYGDGTSNIEVPQLSSSSTDFATRNNSTSGNNQIIRAADGRLFNSELAHSISSHLIDTYIKIIHPQCPIIDVIHWQRNYEAAGRDTRRMSPNGEALGLVLQALASRFSDHPYIIGSGAPSIEHLKSSPGRDFSEYGIARESFARSIADRSLKVIDENGTLRRPSAASAGALLMLEFLLTWDDSYRSTGRHLLTACVEHLRSLADGITEDPTEEKVDQVGTLTWMLYTRSSISSSFGGRSNSLSDDDLLVLCGLLSNPITDDIMSFVSSDDPQQLCGLAVICSFKLITNGFRIFTNTVSGPLARRSPLNEASVRDVWDIIDASKKFSSIYFASVQRAIWTDPPKSDPWFRDLTSMRVQLSFVVHRNICDRLEVEQDGTSRSRDLAYQTYVETLRALKAESDIRFLSYIRDLGSNLNNYGTNLIFLSALSCENMEAYLAHMIKIPTWEEGGNEDWSLANKLEEVKWYLNALKLMSWSWGNYRRSINDATLSLAHLSLQSQHSLGSSRGYTQSPPQPNSTIPTSQPSHYSTLSHLDPANLHPSLQHSSSRSIPDFINDNRTGSLSSDFNSTAPGSSTFNSQGNSMYPPMLPTSSSSWSQPYPSQTIPLNPQYQDWVPRQDSTSLQYQTSSQYVYNNPLVSDSFSLPTPTLTSASTSNEYLANPHLPPTTSTSTEGENYTFKPDPYPTFK